MKIFENSCLFYIKTSSCYKFYLKFVGDSLYQKILRAFFEIFEAPCSRLQGTFCLAALLRSDCKEFRQFNTRSPQLNAALRPFFEGFNRAS